MNLMKGYTILKLLDREKIENYGNLLHIPIMKYLRGGVGTATLSTRVENPPRRDFDTYYNALQLYSI